MVFLKIFSAVVFAGLRLDTFARAVVLGNLFLEEWRQASWLEASQTANTAHAVATTSSQSLKQPTFCHMDEADGILISALRGAGWYGFGS